MTAPVPAPADRLPVADLALCALLAALGAGVYATFFSGWRFVVPLAGAAVLPVALVGVAMRRGLRGRGAVLLCLAPLPLYGAWALFGDRLASGLPGPAAWAAWAGGARHGWARMLTVGLPADPRGDLLVTPVALTWLAAAGGALLAWRRRAALAPLGPPLAAFVAALAFTAARHRPQPGPAVAFALVALTLVLVRSGRLAAEGLVPAGPANEHHPGDGAGAPAPQGRRRRGRRHRPAPARIAAAVPLVAALVVAGAVVSAALPVGADRLDPRDLRHERLTVDDALSPLVTLKAQLNAEGPAELFRLRLDGAPAGVDRVRVAALDAYDGALWTATGEYRWAGTEVGPAPTGTDAGDAAHTVRVRQEVEVLGLEGPFLPALGRPVSLGGADDLAVDPAAGVLVAPSGHGRGTSYEVVSDVAIVSDDDVRSAAPSRSPGLDPYRAVPADLPEPLRAAAQDWAAEADTWSEELLVFRDRLLAIPYDDSPRTQPGHSYAALLRLFDGDRAERRGYAEQFASTFAVLARVRGIPARVAVGYRLPEPEPDGTYRVTEADAHAWPEVALAGFGWVAIEPTDLSRIGRPADAEPEVPDGAGDAPGASGPVGAGEPGVVAGRGAVPGAGGGWAPVAAGAVGLAVLLLVALATPPVAKGVRRRRRRAAGGAARVLGAWRETVDLLGEYGLRVAPAQTPAEVVALARPRFGESVVAGLGALAPLVDRATYAAGEPDADTGRRAWDCERATRRALRRDARLFRRIRARLDPTPLFRRGRAGDRLRATRGAGVRGRVSYA
jgi:hypothetical protein